MAFEFKKKESVRKAVKRLERTRVEKALRALKPCARRDAVHEVRKEIKQLRSLLRLVREVMAKSDYREYSDTLREAASHLAAERDARAKVNALADLTSHSKTELAPHSFDQIKRILSANCRKQQAKMSKARAARKVARLLKRFSNQSASAKLKGSGWAAIGPGIKRSYREGRRGYLLAKEAGAPEHFHEWRKRVKDLLYQTGLLSPIWPEQMNAAQAELNHLAQLLGDDHDLVLLTDRAATKQFRHQAQQETDVLKALVDERQRVLRAQALALGGRFYHEKPAVFCRRLQQYWQRWRHEPRSMTRIC